jgi:hypothetical protein
MGGRGPVEFELGVHSHVVMGTLVVVGVLRGMTVAAELLIRVNGTLI